MARPILALTVFVFAVCGCKGVQGGAEYFGKFLGKLSELHHGVSGEVYAVDARTLHIKDFTYDGQGPAAYFFAGSSRSPSNAGFRIPDENGSPDVLRRYRKEPVTITLPEGKSLNSIKWFSVWCEEFEVNFGDVKIPKNLDYPRPQKIDGLRGVHGISSDNIVIVDAQTLLIPSLSFDGEAPDAKFWVGRGPKPSPQGIRVPDENGKEIPLRRYDRKTVVLTLPADLTVFDIGHFGIWCEAFTVDFGHVQIPQEQLNVPPSLKMLGVSPQSKLNCEVLHDDLAFEVRWAVAGDSIVLQLVAKLENREYMAFGISGDSEHSQMIDGDVVVAWVDKETLKGYADDYYLEAKAQCSGPRGSCPDVKLAENTNNIRLLNAAMVNGYSIVTYQRPLRAADVYDKPVFTNRSQAIIWALGPLNQRDEVSFHSFYTKQDKFIDFGRPAKWNCPMPEGDQPAMGKPAAYMAEEPETITPPPPTSAGRSRGRNVSSRVVARQQAEDSEKSASRQRVNERRASRPVATPAPVANRNAWHIPPIQCNEPDDGVFYAQMGPTGGKHGYPAITGHVGWGISWYINGLLIPEVNLVRGKTYTFVVEGGYDADVPAKYHPFYITDDPIGGYEHKTAEERRNVRIFAGARQNSDGSVHPTGVGRLCHWTQQGEESADEFESFGAYQRTLELKCDSGEPGVIQWTPDKDTPDTVYYQCFSHRYLGWKINVLDACDMSGAASKVDMDGSASINVETRIKPPNNIEEVITKEEREDYGQHLPQLDSKYVFRPDNHSYTLIQLPIPPKDAHRPKPEMMLRRPPAPTLLRPMTPKLRRPTMYVKKPLYRPMVKVPIRRPMMKYTKKPVLIPMQMTTNRLPSNIIIMKAAPFKLHPFPHSPQVEEVPDPQPEANTITDQQQQPSYVIRSAAAVNMGFFDPSSVVIEGGFKPIISKVIDSRADLSGAELDIESEAGVIDESQNDDQATEHFEPMFIPSPVIDVRKRKKHPEHRRSTHDRPNSSYLPPPDRKQSRHDVDVPPATVTTFDGRKVSGASLTPRPGAPQKSLFEGRSAKTAELLRRPQSVPFQGELPPLHHHPPAIIKRMITIRQIRGKREAHHNAEHTAQQERERSTPTSSVESFHIQLSVLYICLVLHFVA